MKKAIFFITLWTMLIAGGQLNVFTGDPSAEIFIDGEFIAKEQVLRHPVEAGTHYLQIKKGKAVLKAQTVNVRGGITETVVVDDFKEYKTDVPSRGSIDVEAMRVRETRGNMAFGLYGGSPASGLSIKWWPFNRFGLQAIGFSNNHDNYVDTRTGGRLLISLNESIFQSSTFTTYFALGWGRAVMRGNDENKIYRHNTYDLNEFALGIEFKVSDFFKNNNSQTIRHVIISDETSALSILLAQFIIGFGEGFLKMTHWSAEIGGERTFVRHFAEPADKSSSTNLGIKFSGGCHIYF